MGGQPSADGELDWDELARASGKRAGDPPIATLEPHPSFIFENLSTTSKYNISILHTETKL